MAASRMILVIGGINGAGKSSVAGRALRETGKGYFNPDEATRLIQQEFGCSTDEANSRAWLEGKQRLEAAIRDCTDFAFESTLGANTIPRLLKEAAEAGFRVVVWFVGLSSPEQHLALEHHRAPSSPHRAARVR